MFQDKLGVSAKTFFKDLKKEIGEDDIFTGAAALTYYILLALFPAMIFVLSLLPYLPIENLDQKILAGIASVMPQEAAKLFSDVIKEVTTEEKGGLLSFGFLATIWAASTGMKAIMRQLNITYDVKEARKFIKARAVAIGLVFIFGVLVIGSFVLVLFGEQVQEWVAANISSSNIVLAAFTALKWVLVFGAMLLGFALTYYIGPNVKQQFRFITPGSLIGVVLLVLASVGFRYYIENFGNYAKTYGSLGAVIILMLWLYIAGAVLLIGSEVNALVEHYHPEGKNKGEKVKSEKLSRFKPQYQ